MEVIQDEEYLINDSTVGVANYLVSLYERTKNKYQYYPTKINKLLTIYKLCSLKYNDECLNDGDFIITDDGTMGMLSAMHNHFYTFFSLIPENYSEITDELEMFNKHKNYLHYRRFSSIGEDSKKLLELIFRKFGNYPYHDLATQINEIVNNLSLRNLYDRNYIESKSFRIFIYNNKKALKHNVIFKFIENFDRLDIDKSYNLNLENLERQRKEIEDEIRNKETKKTKRLELQDGFFRF